MSEESDLFIEDFLEHHGVKGMHWGKSGGRTGRLERVASGKGSTADKIKVATLDVSGKSVRINKTIEGAAANKLANINARNERVKNGNASLKDIIAKHGGDRLVDTGRPDKGRVFTPDSEKIKITSEHSAATKRVIKDHNNLSNTEFFQKHATTKARFKARVEKHGNPENSPLGKIGKKINK